MTWLRGGAVQHRAESPWAYAVGPDTLRVIVRAERGRVVECTVVYGDRHSSSEADLSVPMHYVGTDADFDYFQADIGLQPPRFRYAFVLNDGERSWWLHEQGVNTEKSAVVPFQYPYINEADLFDVPEWLTDGVVYQVFPDRFDKGDPAIDPPDVRLWSDERPTSVSLYGGDLEGIIRRLPHLQELGVTVLYLTPIFQSPTHHKYDTTDYYAIDPHFGDEETLKRLVQQCHSLGMKVILDAVFNHCGYHFFAFQDVLRLGKQSLHADWFHIHEFPVRTEPVPTYETFSNGIASMPKLRTENPELRQYLLDVGRYWIETCDIDGWRIDVANEVDHAFWREFRQVVKKAKPDACIIGEIWHEALPWLQGDQFDGVTNYPVREACLEFFARGRSDAEQFAEAVGRNAFIYPEPMLQASWNLLGSHDTERFVTACGGDMNKVALAVVFNMTWIGTPLVYYGDEIGMEGANDPDCRRPMIWDRERWHDDLFTLHRRLIELRTTTPALQRGRARIVHADAARNTLVYSRGEGADAVIVALNNSGREQQIAIEHEMPNTQVLNPEMLDIRWESVAGSAEASVLAGGAAEGMAAESAAGSAAGIAAGTATETGAGVSSAIDTGIAETATGTDAGIATQTTVLTLGPYAAIIGMQDGT